MADDSPAWPPLVPAPILGAAAGGTSPLAGTIAVVGTLIAGLLAWQLWRNRRAFLMELAEQARQATEEREKAEKALHDLDTSARESQAKSEILATLSREIRAHLNGVVGSADLMLDSALKGAQRDHLMTLRASAESLHQSLDEVLEFSSIESGQIQIAEEPFDLRQPLIDVMESVSPHAQLKDLELVLIVSPDAPLTLKGDPGRLRQVLLNLMSNSVKFTVSGRVALRVEPPAGSAAASASGAGWLHFSVSDTGPGIPEENREAIFERFGQSDTPTPRKFGGSGLELATSKRLVELMGGRIGARNLPEGGAELWVVLPFVPADGPGSPPTATLEGLHVVVLDDLAAARVAASALLTRMGINHDATDTLDNAATLLRDAWEDEDEAGVSECVLLLDDSVARTCGTDIARLLTTESDLSATRIVLMSPVLEDWEATRPPFPVAAILRKPLLREDLLLEALRARAPAGAVRATDSRVPFAIDPEARDGVPRRPRVLVVDDDEISRFVSSQLIAQLDCETELAVSGSEAVMRAKAKAFDLIFMDCQMPGLDGFAATRQIRDAMGGQAPPIVALTANISATDRARCFDAGMCDFVSKPVRKAELGRVLRRWIPQEARPAQ